MSRNTVLVFATIAVFLFISCKNNNDGYSDEIPGEIPEEGIKGISYSASFTDSIRLVLDRYYVLKDAFVKSDTSAIRIAAESMKDAVAVFSVEEFPAIDSLDYLAAKEDPADMLKGLTGVLTEKDIEKQRASFEIISDALLDLLQLIKPKGIQTYNQFCPMAFNDKGASWLSSADSIMNPYYGKKMLHCGEVKQTLRYE